MAADTDDTPGDARPVPPSSRLWWTVPAVGVILLAAFAMVFGGGPEKVDRGTSYDASGGGFRAAYLLLEGLGYPVERSRRPTGGDVRWVLFPSEAGRRTAADLDRWVRQGGTALVAADDAEFVGRMGLTVTVTDPAPERDRNNPFEPAGAAAGRRGRADAPDVSRLSVGETAVEGPPGGRAWGEIDGRPLVAIYPHGRGEVWLLQRPDALTNANLRADDNAVLACRLAEAMLRGRPGGRLAFDETCHGLRDRPSVSELLATPPVLYLTLQALLLAGLVLWHSGVRFGPVRPFPPQSRRSKEEFLDAMGELLTRKGDRAEAFRTVRDEFRHRLEAALGLPAGTPPEAAAREAARRRGIQPGPLAELLSADEPPQGRGSAAFLAALHQLDTAADDCFQPGRRSG